MYLLGNTTLPHINQIPGKNHMIIHTNAKVSIHASISRSSSQILIFPAGIMIKKDYTSHPQKIN